MPCNFCSDTLDGITELKHPQSGESVGWWGARTYRTFYQCQNCGGVWVKEQSKFLDQPVGEARVKFLGYNPDIQLNNA